MATEDRKASVSLLLEKLKTIEEILALVTVGIKELQEEGVSTDKQLDLELDSESVCDFTQVVLPPILSDIPPDIIKLVDRSIVTLYNVIPVGEEDGALVVASYIDNEKNNIPGLSIVLGRSISVISVGEDEFLCARRKYYPNTNEFPLD